MDNYKGFSLFNDIENTEDRNFNRARVLTNMVVDNQSKGKFNIKAVGLSTGYILNIPVADRAAVLNKFKELMKQEGFIIPEQDKLKAAAIAAKVCNA